MVEKKAWKKAAEWVAKMADLMVTRSVVHLGDPMADKMVDKRGFEWAATSDKLRAVTSAALRVGSKVASMVASMVA